MATTPTSHGRVRRSRISAAPPCAVPNPPERPMVALPDQPRTLAQLPADSISPNRLAIRSKLGRGKVVESRIGSPPRRICSEMV